MKAQLERPTAPELQIPISPPMMARARIGSFFLITLLLTVALGSGPLSADEGSGSDDLVVVWIEIDDPADAYALEETIDVWSHRTQNGRLLALVSTEQMSELRAAGFAVEIDAEHTATLPTFTGPGPSLELRTGSTARAGIPGFSCYRTVDETYRDMAQLAAENPRLAQWIDIGDSWQKATGAGGGDDIMALVVTNRDSPHEKSVFLLDSAIHAREYTTAETTARFAEHLIAGYGVDADITWILDHVEVHIIPILNPDGRRQAQRGLLWRKNTNNNFCRNTETRGIDLNRNSSFFWNGPFNSRNECSLVFRGPGPASEPETQALERYMARVFEDQRGPSMNDAAPEDTTGIYISVHSFSELVLPPDWAGGTPPNLDGLNRVAQRLGFLNDYIACRGVLGSASGITVDTAYGVYGVPAYTFELGTSFFQDCSTFENDIYPRNLPALLYAAKLARRPYQMSAGPDVSEIQLIPNSVPRGEPIRVQVVVDDTRYDSNGCGTEPSQNIRYALYTIDKPYWQERFARVIHVDDIAFDEPVERATTNLDTSGLSVGRHTFYAYSVDQDGNAGPPTAVFFEVTPGSDEGPAPIDRPQRRPNRGEQPIGELPDPGQTLGLTPP